MVSIEPILDVTLPIELSNENRGRGYHWKQRDKARKHFEQLLVAWDLRREPFGFPVGLRVTRILGPRQQLWDPDSVLRGTYKELQDSMVACGWFHDDSAEWIRHVFPRQDKGRRDYGPGVQVEVFEWQDRFADWPMCSVS